MNTSRIRERHFPEPGAEADEDIRSGSIQHLLLLYNPGYIYLSSNQSIKELSTVLVMFVDTFSILSSIHKIYFQEISFFQKLTFLKSCQIVNFSKNTINKYLLRIDGYQF